MGDGAKAAIAGWNSICACVCTLVVVITMVLIGIFALIPTDPFEKRDLKTGIVLIVVGLFLGWIPGIVTGVCIASSTCACSFLACPDCFDA